MNKKNVKKILYKGHKPYITYLGKFVAIFEEVVNKQLTAERDFKIKYPHSYQIFDKQIRKNVGHATIDTIPKKLTRVNITLVYNGSNCLIYELCRHIRNSFCHMLLEIDSIDSNTIKIIDKSRNKISSNGSIDKSVFLSFIKTIVEEYEN